VVEGHALAVGWDGGINTRDDACLQHEEPLPGAFPSNRDEHYYARVARMATYAQDEWNVTLRWSVYLGARWEGIQTRTSGNTFDTAESRTSVWSPLFQTLYKLPGTKADQVRFAVTRTCKAPGSNSVNLKPVVPAKAGTHTEFETGWPNLCHTPGKSAINENAYRTTPHRGHRFPPSREVVAAQRQRRF
jgi:outer membrane receptor protein involved in Fe transport